MTQKRVVVDRKRTTWGTVKVNRYGKTGHITPWIRIKPRDFVYSPITTHEVGWGMFKGKIRVL